MCVCFSADADGGVSLVFRKVFTMAVHPDKFQRLGAASVVLTILPAFRV